MRAAVPDAVATHVILLRAIGPATHRIMKMGQWRAAAEAAGFAGAETLVSTGNMIAGFKGTGAAAARAMDAVLRGFGLPESVVALVRRPALLERLVRADPLAGAANPSQTGVFFFSKPKPDFGWIAAHEGPERLHVVDNHLLVDFTHDVLKSAKLIRQIDRQCGLNTARNWNTVRRLAERCAARAGAA
jgi:uncharacterized protein (DUF1697 family)